MRINKNVQKKIILLIELFLVFVPIFSLAFILLNCGPNGIEISGGSSEVGNPQSALQPNVGSDTTLPAIKGIEINLNGNPIKIIRKKKSSQSDSNNIQSTNASNFNDSTKIIELIQKK